MKVAKFILFNLFILLFISCSSSINVRHDYDSEANFDKYKNYDWMPKKGEDKTISLMDKRLKRAVGSEMGDKGYDFNSTNPDFLIAYHTNAKNKIDVDTYGYTYARRGRYAWVGQEVDVRQYKEGTLVLDFIDSKSKELIWRGVASGVLPKYPNPDKISEKLQEAIAEVLKNFPPN